MSIKKIWSINEWGKLREIIIGDPSHSFIPSWDDVSIRSFDRGLEVDMPKPPVGRMDEKVINETKEDIAELSETLRKLNISVINAEEINFQESIKSPKWDVEQESGINIRDLTLIHGNLIIDTASPTRNRTFESWNVRKLFNSYTKRDPNSWYVSMPRPILEDDSYDFSREWGISEDEPLFDAANCARLGSDIIIDINNTANKFGAEWLQRTLDRHYGARKITVHTIECAPDHLDVIIIPIREGSFLVNPKYVTKDSIPEKFRNWEMIVSPEMTPQGSPIGCLKCSNWIGLNVIVVDGEERTLIVEKRQTALIKQLESKGFRPIPVSWRHGRTWGGGFHCVTLDLHREGDL